ncbi:type II toxin-antitoxin system RelB/DinJ family antitoxin [Anaerococcus sp. mt242]|uniref:type II toxin-antitoxin system RelB/DinJ family antitoxin n=1 Tax=Anaerococcus sp. mt242 TaxID=2661917 RepID=UPI0019329EAB|nr:type II toxin-antitoxin system RelB/DinJ family antitoxin [Anaerococcus sp. mt242]MBM0046241.1 type II toxin-antitoxin system RelB/DinJ family antitoxin [Anaerococcus sp. mt242]
MTQSQINVRVDSDTKKDAERICSEIGISLSSAINVYLKKIVRENKIPFELEADPFYSPKNLEKIDQLIEDYEKGKLEIVNHSLIEE